MAQLGILARGVDRENLVDWVHEALALAEAGSSEIAIGGDISPAGVPIEVRFDDRDLATAYCGRFRNVAIDAIPNNRLHVLTGNRLEGLADWNDPSMPPSIFHLKLKEAGLRAAYPFQKRLWRLFDQRSRIGLQWCATPDELPPWDGSAPLRQHLHWMLEESGMRLAHAATLGLENRGVVLFGPGGAGKSGTTLAGLAAGLSTVGDDYIALGINPSPVAKPLFRTIKQDKAGLARIPLLANRTSNLAVNWRGKVEFDPDTYFEGAISKSMPIKAIILPRIAHVEKPTLTPTRAQTAMLSLMTSNLHQFAGEEENGMCFFARFLKGLPCFQLDLSTDALRNGALLREFIERLPE